MNLQSYRQQHGEILAQIDELRGYVRAGIGGHVADIAAVLREMDETVRRHLASEDFLLYPSLGRSPDPHVVALGQAYRREMGDLSGAFRAFIARWADEGALAAGADAFRQEANEVVRALFERIQREDAELYPAAAALAG